jgi:hypothetical protein
MCIFDRSTGGDHSFLFFFCISLLSSLPVDNASTPIIFYWLFHDLTRIRFFCMEMAGGMMEGDRQRKKGE